MFVSMSFLTLLPSASYISMVALVMLLAVIVNIPVVGLGYRLRLSVSELGIVLFAGCWVRLLVLVISFSNASRRC